MAAALCLLRAVPPAEATTPEAVTAPAATRVASVLLQNGITVTLEPVPGSGSVALRGRIDAGSIYDGDRPGLSALATALIALPVLGEAPDHPTLDWTLEREPTAFVNFRWIEFHSRCLPEELSSLLTALAGRLRRAAGEDPETVPSIQLERLRAHVIEQGRQLEASDESQFWRRAIARMYPPDSPLARPPWGSPSGLARLQVPEVLTFLKSRVVPKRTRLVVTGEFEVATCLRLLRETVARVGPGSPEGRTPRAPQARGPRDWTEVTIEGPSRAEDTILVAWPGDRSKRWDYVATRAIVFLLGETASAGLLGRQVVEPGLASSAIASLEEEGAPGFLLVRGRAARGRGSAAAARIREVIEQAARGAFTSSDLESWKARLRIAAARRQEEPDARSQMLFTALVRAPEPPAEQLTLAHLNETARRLLRRGAPLAFVTGSAQAPADRSARIPRNSRGSGDPSLGLDSRARSRPPMVAPH